MLALMYQCGSGADRKMPQNDETCAVKLRGGVEEVMVRCSEHEAAVRWSSMSSLFAAE
jgi:hypothetical protein